MITEQLNAVIQKYGIEKTGNIIYGTNIPMPTAVIPTPWKTYVNFEQTAFYFFYFDENGIIIYRRDGQGFIEIPWTDVLDFKISHILILGKMTITTRTGVYKFQLNRFVVGCPWIGKNTKRLESIGYYYKKQML